MSELFICLASVSYFSLCQDRLFTMYTSGMIVNIYYLFPFYLYISK